MNSMESEKKHRLLISNLPNCFYQGYMDFSIDFFDDKIEQITGYCKEDFLSREKNWIDLVHNEDLAPAIEKFKQALRTDKTYLREYRVLAKNGNIIWVQDGGQIILSEDGKIELIIGAFLDITTRKEAEKALHESEEKYRSIFDSGPNPTFILDRKTLEILDANPMAEETYGYKKTDLTGKHFSYLGPVEELNNKLALFTQKNQDFVKACVISSKVQHYKSRKIPFYVKVTACPISYKDSDAIILATTDITEMLDKEIQLLQANKMSTLGEMSAGIAHELNQPLNAIQMGSEYLKMIVETQKKVPPKKMIEVSNQINDQIARATEIITRLREFGRKPDFVKNKIDINDVIRIVYGIVNQQLLLQDIKLNIILDEGLPPILAHKTQIEQVIFNLVTNAADAIKQKKEENSLKEDFAIRICSFIENDLVAVTVSDTGIGIPDDLKDKVFEPFFTTKEVGKGMGLGLSIIYGIIKDYGGEIEIQSEKDVGTNIKLTFPGTKE